MFTRDMLIYFCLIGSSPIQYHQICIRNRTLLCFRDNFYLCICGENHTRVECLLYDEQLDRCSHCLSGGRCLKGNPHRSNDFICLCSSCHSGRQCQFSTKSFSFTLDQLFSPDLLSARKQTTVSLLLFFSLLFFVLAVPHNFFAFITLRRPSCLRNGIGHYLLWMSVIDQVGVALLAARLIHLSVIMTMFQSSPMVDDLFCKLLSYFLTCTTRFNSWLSSFIALERVYTTVFLNKKWFKQPHVACCLMLMTFGLILLSAAYELIFVKSFSSVEDEHSVMCVIEYPPTHRSMSASVHQMVSIISFLFPLLINLCSTVTIMSIVIKNKMNICVNKNGTLLLYFPPYHKNRLSSPCLANTGQTPAQRRTALRNVLSENREMITRPAITLAPSVFSLFSVPLFIISFSLGCQNLKNSPIRYLLITFYFITYLPHILMFYLYIYPSSFYWKEWQSTHVNQRITALRKHHSLKHLTTLPNNNEQTDPD